MPFDTGLYLWNLQFKVLEQYRYSIFFTKHCKKIILGGSTWKIHRYIVVYLSSFIEFGPVKAVSTDAPPAEATESEAETFFGRRY